MIDSIVQFTFPTQILFGPQSIGQLSSKLSQHGISAPMIVTDQGFLKTKAFQKIQQTLGKGGIEWSIFDSVQSEPSDQVIDQALAVYREHLCDGLIGLGGGSSLDAAKAIALLSVNTGRATDYDVTQGGGQKIQGPFPPIVAIPTTSGTGSEVGRCAVIMSKEANRKIMICHPSIMPELAILDPEMTLELPPSLTAATGMDALSHCLESLTSPVFHPLCDAIALKGIEYIAQYLEKAFLDPNDIEARGAMQLASMMGAVAFQKDLGATHSLAHALSAMHQIHHGLANAVCLAPVMHYNKGAAAKAYAKVAACFGVNTFHMSDFEAAEQAIASVRNLIKRLKIPGSLAELGIQESQLPKIARTAFLDPCHQTNPKACTEDNLLSILKNSLAGHQNEKCV